MSETLRELAKNYFLAVPLAAERTVWIGSENFMMVFFAFSAQGYLRPSNDKTISKIGNQNRFKIHRIETTTP